MRGRLLVSLALAAFAAAVPASASAHAARFEVGAAVRSLDPSVPVYAGGFSLSPPITKVRDPLQVRAFCVAHGSHAVAFAVVDSQAYFAAYQEGAHYGITSARTEAAHQIAAAGGLPMSRSDIIVQGTHSHAAPTLEGIWGPVPPRYLKLVHDRTVAALVAAARKARSAKLRFATIHDRNIAGVNIDQDSYEGWTNDTQISALEAVNPRTGAEIASFDSVPTHGAHICGACRKELSADYFGAVRASLDRKLGGINVVGPATLGREESPVETTGPRNMEWLSGIVANDITRALARAKPVTNPTIAADESPVRIPATNEALIALVDAWSLPDAQKEAIAQASGIYPIDRANTPPYLTGDVIGTYVTAVRVGPLAFLSMPGEPFPEIRFAIADAVHGARAIVALSKGQDDLGYFFPAWVYPFPAVYGSDHHIFSVAPQAGDQIVAAQAQNLAGLGFDTGAPLERPLPTRLTQKAKPGLQAMASPPAGDANRHGVFRPTLQAIFSPASVADYQLDGPVRWDFGDGTHRRTSYLEVGQDYGQTGQGHHGRPVRFRHAFSPGSYRVSATATDSAGNQPSWTFRVRVYRHLRASIAVRRHHGRYVLRARHRGGDGAALAYRWRLGDGQVARGARIVSRHLPQGAIRLTLVDGTGTRAHATCRVVRGDPSPRCKR